MKVNLLATLSLIGLVFAITSCTQSPQKQAENLVKKQLETSLHDMNSYESVEFGTLDSAFSQVEDLEEYKNYSEKIEELNSKYLKAKEEFEKVGAKSELIEKENEKIIYTMLFFTFLYGIVHSFGPGHGKTLVLTYSVKEKLNLAKLLLVSFLIAYLQGLSAYILVKFIINLSDKASMMLFYDLDNRTRLIASILIILIGLYNIYSVLRNKSCEHCHETKVKNILGFSIVLGLCPCPGVMTVLLFLESFGLSENLFLFTLSMSTGIFLVILFFGILANTFKKTLVEEENFKLHKILALVGASLMILFGIFQILIL